MKNLKTYILLFIIGSLTTGCFEDKDDTINTNATASEINDFVWKGMNFWYLYKDNVPNLANNRFSSDQEYADYLNSFSTPEDLFESLIYQRGIIDKFSWITDDYIANEQMLNGIALSNGMEYGLFRFSSQDTDVYGYVRYVLPNTDAESKGLQRGDLFNGINGTQLTINNYNDLLSLDNYTINFGVLDDNGTVDTTDDFIASSGQTASLTKTEYTENPIYLNRVLNIDGNNVGYLMYNGFNGSSSELNDVFRTFKSAGITDLVIDLRYNPGGFGSKAVLMSSLITGQFTGEILNVDQYNSELQTAFETEDPEFLVDRFINSEDGMSLSSLNLNKVYILATSNSASASELVINSLDPYIDVVQIGTNTRGKYQGSYTFYDSPNFGREGANPNHTYALQPLTFKYANVIGNTDFIDGLVPDILLNETVRDLGVLGDENEPLLAKALEDIAGTGRATKQKDGFIDDILLEVIDNNNLKFRLFSDKEIPSEITKRFQFND